MNRMNSASLRSNSYVVIITDILMIYLILFPHDMFGSENNMHVKFVKSAVRLHQCFKLHTQTVNTGAEKSLEYGSAEIACPLRKVKSVSSNLNLRRNILISVLSSKSGVIYFKHSRPFHHQEVFVKMDEVKSSIASFSISVLFLGKSINFSRTTLGF